MTSFLWRNLLYNLTQSLPIRPYLIFIYMYICRLFVYLFIWEISQLAELLSTEHHINRKVVLIVTAFHSKKALNRESVLFDCPIVPWNTFPVPIQWAMVAYLFSMSSLLLYPSFIPSENRTVFTGNRLKDLEVLHDVMWYCGFLKG